MSHPNLCVCVCLLCPCAFLAQLPSVANSSSELARRRFVGHQQLSDQAMAMFEKDMKLLHAHPDIKAPDPRFYSLDNAYLLFCLQVRSEVQAAYPHEKPSEIDKRLGRQWSALTRVDWDNYAARAAAVIASRNSSARKSS